MLEKAIPRGTAPSRAFTAPTRSTPRLNLCQDDVKNGLGRLVLTLVKLLHELLERQAVRRMDGGALSEPEIEALGMTLMKQAEEIERLRKAFGLEEEDLDIDLGPLGKLF
ncbi:MAG: gas vesicle protein K [Planctomycetes bacterium]|nr:gas vesicle protein K [Planctomycetota bacterium]